MKKWITVLLSVIMLLSVLSGCKQEEIDLTPDDKMTIAICALARSVKAQKEAAKPVCYSVKGVRTLDGMKTMETTASYDSEKMFTVIETRHFEEQTLTDTEITYTYVVSENGKYQIISAKQTVSEGYEPTKEYSVLYTGESLSDVESAWAVNGYGADMTYQTCGRLEDLIVSAAMSQGGAEAAVTSADDFKLTITSEYKTEQYTIEDNYITQFVWTEMTVNGEDVNTWNYYWNITDVTLPDLAEFVLVAE